MFYSPHNRVSGSTRSQSASTRYIEIELYPAIAIADPNIALVLIVIGALGIFAEFSRPGLIIPGVAGTTAALIGLASMAAYRIDWRGAAVVLIAFLAFAFEAKLITHGILTAAGAAALLAGSVMLVDSADPARRIHWSTAAAVTIPFALITSFLLSVALRARRNKIVTAFGESGAEKTHKRESKSQS
jgi:membrane-bound serine protease (ClpP class)